MNSQEPNRATDEQDGICLSEAWEIFGGHSGRASDVNRQLAFAAIGIVWVFRGAEGLPSQIPDLLMWAGLFGALALAADLLHYVSASLCWGVYATYKELRDTRTDARFRAPRYINHLAYLFFSGKIVAVAIAYGFISTFLIKNVR